MAYHEFHHYHNNYTCIFRLEGNGETSRGGGLLRWPADFEKVAQIKKDFQNSEPVIL